MKKITVKFVIEEENLCEFADGYLVDEHHAICFPNGDSVWLVKVASTNEPNVFDRVSTYINLGEIDPDNTEDNHTIAQRLLNRMNSITLWRYVTKDFDWTKDVDFDLV